VLGLLNVTLEALELYPQLIKGGSSPRQVTPRLSLRLFKLGYTVTDILQPCLDRLLALTTLTLQRLGISTHSLQISVTRTAYQTGEEQTHQHKHMFHRFNNVLLTSNHKMCTPIPGPGRFIMPWVERALLPITNSRETSCTDAGGGEVLFRGIGTTLTESHIILVRATLVTVPFNLGSYGTILIQKSSFPIEDGPSIRAQVVLIKVEINILILELLERLLAN